MTREELEYRYAANQKDLAQINLEKRLSVARAYSACPEGRLHGEALAEARRMALEANVYADETWQRYFRQLSARTKALRAL